MPSANWRMGTSQDTDAMQGKNLNVADLSGCYLHEGC